MCHTETHRVPPQKEPVRLQEYGVGIFKAALTKSALKKALKNNYLTVNRVIAQTGTYIKGGETITLTIPIQVPSKRRFACALTVLFEDPHLAAIQKPAGIRVSGNHFKTIANALSENISPSTLPDATTPQPVHRLDYATTGILLIGKTSSGIRSLNALFESRAIVKTYYAVTIGEVRKSGEITSPIDGKEAQTTYTLLASVDSNRFGLLNLLRLQPHTGRRHQLRRHLSEMGTPILGDPEYGSENLRLKGKGIYLHAHSLAFTHPFSKEKMYLSDALPLKFNKIFPTLAG